MHPFKPFVADDVVGKEFCGVGKQRSMDCRLVEGGSYGHGVGNKGIK